MIDFFSSGISGYSGSTVDEQNSIYLNRYWLDINDIKNKWAEQLDRVFDITGNVVSILPGFKVDRRLGGVIFTEKEFVEFKEFSVGSGAKSFAVIEYIGQDQWSNFSSKSFLRFSYPMDVSWSELVCSCAIADDMFGRPIREYFVVSNNAFAGKYVNNDAPRPYELLFSAL